MAFNFGSTPFKHPPMEGFKGFSEADDKVAVPNHKSGSETQERKIVANAPQALIIEVSESSFSFIARFLVANIFSILIMLIFFGQIQPSRELAEQTLNQIVQFRKHLDQPAVKELLVVGGVSVQEQIKVLKSGVDIVVATPGA